MKTSARDTPMMRQFLAIKANHPDAIVFYRMGDFYEMFMRDAEVAAPLLDIALTTRDRGKEDAVPMCGIPVHAALPHIKRLAGLGHRVAICEQVEDPKSVGGKRLVRREVVEVVTPGLIGDPDGIEGSHEPCLTSLAVGKGSQVGLAILDASTGELRATQVDTVDGSIPSSVLEELGRVDPREILIDGSSAELTRLLASLLPNAALTVIAASDFDPTASQDRPEGFDAGSSEASMCAAAALLSYVRKNQPFALSHASRLRVYQLTDAMILDAATRTHLELFRNTEDGGRARTLIYRLDLSMTALGARRLARWLAYPLVDIDAIRHRQDAVASLSARDRLRLRLRDALKPIRDLERLLAKAARPAATPRDLAALRTSLEGLPRIATALDSGEGELLPPTAGSQPDSGGGLCPPVPVGDIARLLREGLIDDPPAIPKGSRGANETGYIRDDFRPELDALRGDVDKGRVWIAGFEARERERTGIATLKIRFHPVHGYGIEVTRAQLGRVPADYERKQTLANAERFTTEELRSVEQSVKGGTGQAASLEREIFEELRQAVMGRAEAIREAAGAVAKLDAIAALAEVGRRDGWVRPLVDDSVVLEIRGGRHAVVEPLLTAGGGEFVPNDADLDSAGNQILVLTGPNMSGKSTYLRQVALTVLLAQMGSFVPAESARVGIVDRVFTRVGASDRVARGESTFMVEMRETAEILANASRRSLVILDEIGRGTSTFDGLSIAWAVAEYLHDAAGLGARTLFATHYHELADLARTKDRVVNAHFEAREWGDEVIFMRRLKTGAANRSYGIQVARLAGLPKTVIERAREILANLESGELDDRGRPRIAVAAVGDEPEGDQLGLFSGARPAAEPGPGRDRESSAAGSAEPISPIE
ncbi:MAG: DNA mismatch repair protein MutS, partial [Myxococcota bacterium]